MKSVRIRTVYVSRDYLLMRIESSKILGIMKDFTSEAEAPTLQILFMIIDVPKEEVFGEEANDDEMGQIGMSILRLRKSKKIKHMQLGSSPSMGSHYSKNSND